MAGVEGEECDALLLPGVLRLHLPDGLQGFVHASEGLLLDDGHGTAFVHDDEIVYSLCLVCLHSCNCLMVKHLLLYL